MKLDKIKLNDGSYGLPKNPRFIKDDRFKALCKSVKDNPEYMPARPIIVDERGVILGGNMRYRACRELGMTDIPDAWVQMVKGWSVEKKRRFILIDNKSYGEYDNDILGNEFDLQELLDVGIELPDIDGDLEEPTDEQSEALSPIRRFHVLLSMTSDQALILLPKIEELLKDQRVEVCHAGN